MELTTGGYYHIYNRSNDRQVVFREHENYMLFLSKYERMLSEQLDTIAYCLMPTHFHVFARVKALDTLHLRRTIGKLESSYTQRINYTYNRTGSLFQNHTKAKEVLDLEGMERLIRYIHQNPVRAGHVYRVEDWPYSSVNTIISDEPSPMIQLSKVPAISSFMAPRQQILLGHQQLIHRADVEYCFDHNPARRKKTR